MPLQIQYYQHQTWTMNRELNIRGVDSYVGEYRLIKSELFGSIRVRVGSERYCVC